MISSDIRSEKSSRAVSTDEEDARVMMQDGDKHTIHICVGDISWHIEFRVSLPKFEQMSAVHGAERTIWEECISQMRFGIVILR
jgi:hypothetical protein